jgi:hypothetical protein
MDDDYDDEDDYNDGGDCYFDEGGAGYGYNDDVSDADGDDGSEEPDFKGRLCHVLEVMKLKYPSLQVKPTSSSQDANANTRVKKKKTRENFAQDCDLALARFTRGQNELLRENLILDLKLKGRLGDSSMEPVVPELVVTGTAGTRINMPAFKGLWKRLLLDNNISGPTLMALLDLLDSRSFEWLRAGAERNWDRAPFNSYKDCQLFDESNKRIRQVLDLEGRLPDGDDDDKDNEDDDSYGDNDSNYSGPPPRYSGGHF